jgi:Ca2+-binding EF-hand superfamily protein
MSISGVGSGAQFMRSFQPPSFNSIDSDSSGAISLEELKSGAPGGATDSKSAERAAQLFKAMDTDSNGSVSSDEKDAFDSKLEEQRQSMQFMTQLMAGGMQPPSNDDIFAATDTDGSGSVSLDEFSSSASASDMSTDDISSLFSAIDSDSDGSISSTDSSDFLDAIKSAMTGGPMGGLPSGGGPGGPGGPPPGGPPPDSSSEDDETDSNSLALDLLTAAKSAYSTKTKTSDDLLTTLSKLFDQAA